METLAERRAALELVPSWCRELVETHLKIWWERKHGNV